MFLGGVIVAPFQAPAGPCCRPRPGQIADEEERAKEEHRQEKEEAKRKRSADKVGRGPLGGVGVAFARSPRSTPPPYMRTLTYTPPTRPARTSGLGEDEGGARGHLARLHAQEEQEEQGRQLGAGGVQATQAGHAR